LRLIGGLGSGQTTVITGYNGATQTCTFAALSQAGDSTTLYEITSANRPAHGIRVNTPNCLNNRILHNDCYKGGQTIEGLSDAGTGTIKCLPVAEGGTSTNDLTQLPGDVGSVGGWFITENGKGLKIKSNTGIAETALEVDPSNNCILQSYYGGDVK